MKSGQTARMSKPSRATEKSKKTSQRQSSAGLKKYVAHVRRDGKWLEVAFSKSHVTQARNRSEALVMAADYLACIQGRPVGDYFSRWEGDCRIVVVCVPGLSWMESINAA